MNISSMLGLLIGIGALVGGNFLEGGKTSSIFQPTAAFIVFGGTFGATLLSYPAADIFRAISVCKSTFVEKRTEPATIVEAFLRYSDMARREGLMALEGEIPGITNDFFRRGMSLAVDRMGNAELRETMVRENFTYETEYKRCARVFETAGGFAPTIGILGAVLGLIHVMKNLSDPSNLGSGIAVAFVATVYGVALANLIFLPLARQMINRMYYELSIRDMIIEGVIGIQSGFNPYFLRIKLEGFLEGGRAR